MANLVKEYAAADASRKVDLIYKHFSVFLRAVDSRTAGLMYLIENEKISNKRAEEGELGVKVKKSSRSDPTANKAINNLITREALIACDFSGGILEGTDREEEFRREAYILKGMRQDYDLFTRQVECLDETNRKIFISYINRSKSTVEIADEIGIGLEAARNRIYKIKVEVKEHMLEYMEGRL